MLKVLRSNIKNLSFILWAVILAFVLLVFVDFGGTVPGAPNPTSAAATVNGTQISVREFQDAYRNAQDIYRQIYGEQYTPDLARQLRLPEQVLNSLVDQKLLVAEAERAGLEATPEEISRLILDVPAFKDENDRFVGQEVYERTLRSNGLTIAGFESSLREQIMTNKLRAALGETTFVTDADVERSYRDSVEKAKIEFIEVPLDSFEVEEPTESELGTYFDANAEEFRLPEKRSVEYLKIETQAMRDSITVADAEARSYYDDNIDRYRTDEGVRARHILLKVDDNRTADAARAELEAVRSRIAGGEEFAAVAGEVSEDTVSAARGGDLGFFGRGQMIGAFEEAAFNGAIGELIGPIETDFGLHLIEVLEKREAGQRSFEEVADQIRSQLTAERVQTVVEEKAAELAEALGNDPTADLATLAGGEFGVSVEVASAFGRDESVPGIGRSPAFSGAAFELETGGVSEQLRIPGGWAVLRLQSIEEPRLPQLTEVEEDVRTAVIREKRRERATADFEATRQELVAGKDLATVAEELGVEVSESSEFGRDGSIGRLGRNEEIAEAALSLAVSEIGGPIENGDAMVLFRVSERTEFDPVAFDAEKEATRERLKSEAVTRLLTSIVAERRETANISFNAQLMASLSATSEPATG